MTLVSHHSSSITASMCVQCSRFACRRALAPAIRVFMRSVATEANSNSPTASGEPAAPAINSENPRSRSREPYEWQSDLRTLLQKQRTQGKRPVKDETPQRKTPAYALSTLHWSLSKGYQDGLHVQRSSGVWERIDETGIPKWGDWGIPVKFHNIDHPKILVFPHFWLRDNCRCAKCVNQDTMQRAFDTFSIPPDIVPDEVVVKKEGLQVKWANDGHVSMYRWEWLRKQDSRLFLTTNGKQATPPKKTTYWGSEIKAKPPSVSYDEIMANDKGVGKWTEKIREYGFCFVDGCPVSPEKTQELLERIAFVRVTHYGGFYDFTSDLTMKDTAYTALALKAHTDTTYFTDPAGLQMFHLLSHNAGSGGSSLLVDGFQAARTLQLEDMDAYRVLAQTPLTWHASGNQGITITPAKKFAVFGFDETIDYDHPKLLQVRWNNDDRGTVPLNEKSDKRSTVRWYAAARKWNEILTRKNMEYWEQLVPGRPLIFDNWRVLHGRSAFTGQRRICGGYISHDDFVSRWRNTNYSRDEALSQIL